MTIFLCDGFEAYGNTSSAGADVQTRIESVNRQLFDEVSGGHGGDVELIDDYQSLGFALQFPSLDAGRSEWVNYEFPDGTTRHPDYKLPANASAPIMCAGFRFFNADTSPGLLSSILQIMSTATGSQSTLRRDSTHTDLTFVDSGSNTYQATNVITADTWHYIEVEWKFTTSGNGGYAKIYVDGTLVIDTGAASISNFTFNSSYGFRVGCSASSNQTGGNQIAIDDVYCMEIDGVEHTAPLGEVRVFAIRPTSDATPNDWTPSTGSNNYELIDEDSYDTSDYLDALATGDDDHYGLASLENAITVHGCRIDVACVAVDGTPNIHIGFDDGTADEEDMGTIATGTTDQVQEFFEADPSGATWTVSSVDSVEATQRMTE